jgi:hypothetical protein
MLPEAIESGLTATRSDSYTRAYHSPRAAVKRVDQIDGVVTSGNTETNTTGSRIGVYEIRGTGNKSVSPSKKETNGPRCDAHTSVTDAIHIEMFVMKKRH